MKHTKRPSPTPPPRNTSFAKPFSTVYTRHIPRASLNCSPSQSAAAAAQKRSNHPRVPLAHPRSPGSILLLGAPISTLYALGRARALISQARNCVHICSRSRPAGADAGHHQVNRDAIRCGRLVHTALRIRTYVVQLTSRNARIIRADPHDHFRFRCHCAHAPDRYPPPLQASLILFPRRYPRARARNNLNEDGSAGLFRYPSAAQLPINLLGADVDRGAACRVSPALGRDDKHAKIALSIIADIPPRGGGLHMPMWSARARVLQCSARASESGGQKARSIWCDARALRRAFFLRAGLA